MAKRTPSSKLKDADLHTMPVQDTVMMNPSNTQPLPPVVKSAGKTKVKAKTETLRDDEPLASDQDVIVNTPSQYTSADASQDVLLAQANTSSSAPSAPSSVGEDLLRQAGPVSKTSSAAETSMTDFIPKGWGMPLAIGGGVLAVASASGGGGGSSSPSTKSSTDNGTNTDTTPQTYALSITPMAGKFTGGGIAVDIYKNGVLWKTVSTTDSNSTFNANTGQFLLTVNRSELNAKDVLHLVLRDTNGPATNYKDETSNQSADLGANQLNALLEVPGAITDTGTLSLAITPLTELAYRNMGSPSPTAAPLVISINGANNAVAKAFGLQQDGLNVDLVQTAPVATNDATFKTADANAQAYGKALALISSLAVKNNAVEAAGKAPTTDALSTALTQLQNPAKTGSDYTLSDDAKAKLSEAVIYYNNKIGATATKLPGIALADAVGLDGAVSLYDYETNGLEFSLYAPAGKKAGDTVTLKFQAYKTDGSLDENQSFTFDYKLQSTVAPTDLKYAGEQISLPRLFANPNDKTQVSPLTDAQGHTLLGIAQPWTDGLRHYKVSIDGVSALGSYQDFKLNPSPIHITNLSNDTPQGFVKAGDSVQVDVVLDQDVFWGVGDAAAPTLSIQYVDINGSSKTLTASLDPSTGKGHVLSFKFNFEASTQANGPITLLPRALTGEVLDVYGNPLNGYLEAVTTTVTDSHFFADTTLPPSVSLVVADSDPSKNLIVSKGVAIDDKGDTADFVNTNTPTLKVSFMGGADGLTPSDTLSQESKPVTVQLFAYRADGSVGRNETDFAIATTTVAPGGTATFGPDTYSKDWTSKSLDADGKAYKFYAKVIDAAGNESDLIADTEDLTLWLDTQPPVAASVTFDLDGSAPAGVYDPLPSDNQTSNTKPTLSVKGAAGSTVTLYEVQTGTDGKVTYTHVDTSTTKIPGYVGGSDDSSVSIKPSDDLSEGTHVFVTTLTDPAGNISQYSAPVTVVIDKTPANAVTLAIDNPPASGYYRAGDTIDISATFDEKVYLDPSKPAPELTFKNKGTGGTDLTAKLKTGDDSGLGTNTLHFSYTVPSGQGTTIDSLDIPFSTDTISFYNADSLVDHVGNATPLSPTLTVSKPENTLKIDTTPPAAPTVEMGPNVTGLVSIVEATDASGVVKVTADAGTQVDVTFSTTLSGVNKTVTKTIAATDNTSGVVNVQLTDTDLNKLGITAINNATVNVSAIATDSAGNTSKFSTTQPSSVKSFSVDTLAPTVTAAAVASGTPSVIGHIDSSTIGTVNFTVTFSEGFAPDVTLLKEHFAINEGLGTINSVTPSTTTPNTYIVNATPVDESVGNLVLQLVANGGGAQLKDAAGNPMANADLNTSGLTAVQKFDTQAPTVIQVVDDATEAVTNKATLKFTVQFSEKTIAKYDVTQCFSVTHGQVTAVAPDSTTGSPSTGYTTYIVTVQIDKDVPSGNVQLSLQTSLAGAFADPYGNLVAIPDGGLTLGAQAIDTKPPAAPTIVLNPAVTGPVSQSEAAGGVVQVTAEPDSRVDVTFSTTVSGSTKTKTKSIASASASGDVLALNAADLADLGVTSTPGATVTVTAKATDAAGNVGPEASPMPFTLDTVAPVVSAVTGASTSTAGSANISFTVTFSENLNSDLTTANFALKDSTLGTIDSVTKSTSDAKQYTVVVKPALGKTGDIALTLKGSGVADVAGNPLVDADLSGMNKQAINTVAPKVLSVTDDFTGEWANASSTIRYTVTFDKALNTAGMSADQLKAAFTDNKGVVQSVSKSSDTVYVVTVNPTANQDDAYMWLNIVADKLKDALGNAVQATSLEGLDKQRIDTLAPLAPSKFVLNADSDTGSKDGKYTSVTAPQFDLGGLETGASVTIYQDNDGSGTFNTGDTLLWRGTATDTQITTPAITSALADGSYTNIRVVQTDVHGNVGASTVLPELVIQSKPPVALQNLVFDDYQDTHSATGASLPSSRDYKTYTPVPQFSFQGGTANGTAVLFLDKNHSNSFDAGDEELGRAPIQGGTATSTISVDPLHALSQGTYGPSSSKGEIGIVEVNAAGVMGVASMLNLSPTDADATSDITGLTINPAPAQSITIESSQAKGLTNQTALSFNVKTGGQLGGTITVTADAVDTVDGTTRYAAVLGTVASPNGSGAIALDVSSLASTGNPIKYTSFKAYQTYAGVRSTATADVVFTGGSTANTDGITFDHAAPTVVISTTDKTSLFQGDTTQIKFSFSEAVTDFTADDIVCLGGGSVSDPVTTDGGKTWTATYTPQSESTTPVSLSLMAGAVQDAAHNTNAAASASTNTALALTINTVTQKPPVNTLPTDPTTSTAPAVVGTALAISGVSVADDNQNLAKVELSVDSGTLSIAATSGVTIAGSGTSTLTLTPTGSGSDATVALNTALGKLMFTASAAGGATLTIRSTDTPVGGAAAFTNSDTLTLANITAAPAAPVNIVPTRLDTTTTAIVAGQPFSFKDSSSSNAITVSDVNNDITQVELSVAKGTLSIDSAGLTGVSFSGLGTSKLTLTPTGSGATATATDALNAALAKLTYTASGTAAASDTLTIKTTDGTSKSDTDTVALSVNATPIAPVNTVPTTLDTTSKAVIVGTSFNFKNSGNTISVADGDNNLASVKLSVTKGTLSIADTTGVNITGAGTSALTLTPTGSGSDATAALNTALEKLTYTSNADATGDDSLQVVTTDNTAANLGGAKEDRDAMTFTVNAAPIAPVNTVPTTLDTTSKAVIVGTSFNFKDSGNTISVADGDNNLASVKLSVTKGTLSITDTTGVNITGAGTSALTLTPTGSGSDATAALNTALEKLTYTSNAGYTGNDSLQVVTTDNTAANLGGVKEDRDTMTFTVNAAPIAPINTVPTTLTGVLTGQAKAISGITVSDADNNLASVTLSVGHGILGVTPSTGVTVENNNTGTVTLKGSSAAQLNAVLATLTYTSNAGYTFTDTLTVATADSTAANLDGPKTTTNAIENFQVLAAPVNTISAPSGVKGGTPISLSGLLSVDDADNNLSSVKLQVTDGVLSTTTTGVTSADSGHTLTFTGTKAAINEALATLSYTYADQHGTTGVSLTMTSTDSSIPALTDVDTVSFNVAQADNVSPSPNSVTITTSTDFNVGATLSANTDALVTSDLNGVGAFTYQWTRNIGSTSTVVGTNSATYAVTGADAGATLSVKVSYTDGAGYSETNVSLPTTSITWPSSLPLNNVGSSAVSLSFYDDPSSPYSHPAVLSTSSSAKFMALQQGKYYVLDVNGDGSITSADKTTYASGLASTDSSITTASGVKLQLLSQAEWSTLMTGIGSLPDAWFGGSDNTGTADYWTRDIGGDGAHKVCTPATSSARSIADDATGISVSNAYHYNVFQVIG